MADPEIQPSVAAAVDAARSLSAGRRHDEAAAVLEEALAQRPEAAELHQAMGIVRARQYRYVAAETCHRRALELGADRAESLRQIAAALHAQGDADEAAAMLRSALEIRPDQLAHNHLLFALLSGGSFDPREVFEEHVRFAARYSEPLKPAQVEYLQSRHAGRRLRIGYVSPDLWGHPVAMLIGPVLAARDRSGSEIFLYSDTTTHDAMTDVLRRIADGWRDVRGLSDEQLCDVIHGDRIDVLVDLAGHTAQNRLTAFARKPAPVQVTYLGYPATTGLSAIDYRITDALADPPGMTDALHTERLYRLPHCFLCYAPPAGDFPPSPPDVRQIVFGSFNRLAKVTPQMIALWSRILQSVPEAKMLIKSPGLDEPELAERLRRKFAAHGITADRLELRGRVEGLLNHLRTYDHVSISLDTFPYNGTTTTCESIWMGVPVITLAGTSHVARVGLSLLSNIGATELVAEDAEQYVSLAVELARDRPRLKELKASLRARLMGSELADAPRFARDLDHAYRQMWRTWCASQSA